MWHEANPICPTIPACIEYDVACALWTLFAPHRWPISVLAGIHEWNRDALSRRDGWRFVSYHMAWACEGNQWASREKPSWCVGPPAEACNFVHVPLHTGSVMLSLSPNYCCAYLSMLITWQALLQPYPHNAPVS